MPNIYELIKQFNDSRQAGDHDKTIEAIQSIRSRPDELSEMQKADLFPEFQNYETYHQKFVEGQTNQKLMAKFAAKVAERNSPEAVFAKAENLRVSKLRDSHRQKVALSGQNLSFTVNIGELEPDDKKLLPDVGRQVVDNIGIDRAERILKIFRELKDRAQIEKRGYVFQREISFSSVSDEKADFETCRELVANYASRVGEIEKGIKEAIQVEKDRDSYLQTLL